MKTIELKFKNLNLGLSESILGDRIFGLRAFLLFQKLLKSGTLSFGKRNQKYFSYIARHKRGYLRAVVQIH